MSGNNPLVLGNPLNAETNNRIVSASSDQHSEHIAAPLMDNPTMHNDSDHESSSPTLHSVDHEHGPIKSTRDNSLSAPEKHLGDPEKTGMLGLASPDTHQHPSHITTEKPAQGHMHANQGSGGGAGTDEMTAMGLSPMLSRRISKPPAVSPWGGVAPSGEDAEEGLRPLRSREEEDERDLERVKSGPDKWAVKFEPGEKINPKVCLKLYVFVSR